MKKMFSCIVLLLLSAALSFSAFAEFENPPITDNAGYLTKSELAELTEKLEEIRWAYDFEVAIYTETEMSGNTAEETADDIYDYNGYGAGEGADGIMLYIAKDVRQYHFTTCGEGLWAFNDSGLLYLESEILPYLRSDDYYGAFEAFAETCEELLLMASQGDPYGGDSYDTDYPSGGYSYYEIPYASPIGVIVILLLAPILIAFIMMKMKLRKMKTAVANDYAANYMKRGSMNLAVSRDIFLYSRTTKTAKPKETVHSSSGSGASMHTSSSGRTHGGRGGGF